MKKYGCIGKKLTHSFSKEIHAKLADYEYELMELTEEEIAPFFEEKAFAAFNVTIPYKQTVIPYLDWVSPIASRIGAVNTIVNKEGQLYGYNTDYYGMKALMERPLGIYEELCREHGFVFQKQEDEILVCGNLTSGHYTLRGDVSSQFVTGLIFALVYLNKDASIHLLPPIESRSYIDLTIDSLKSFGTTVDFLEDTIRIGTAKLRAYQGKIEGDYSNAAFLDAFNYLGSDVKVQNLCDDSLQGDRVYRTFFEQISAGMPSIEISDCPDLGPILFALAALKHGATFTGTDRLKIKESDRGMAMHEELKKLGGGLIFGDNAITVPKQTLQFNGTALNGHNDHRIVMALSVILSQIGGTICGVSAVRKSYPGFFEDIKSLGAEVELQ